LLLSLPVACNLRSEKPKESALLVERDIDNLTTIIIELMGLIALYSHINFTLILIIKT